jgi:ceramide glucosyltransferase
LIARRSGIRARVLVGDNLATPNPKLNNIAKGWRAAQCDWVVIADSNLMMPADCVSRLMAARRRDTGLVCAPPIGDQPKGFWAEVECAFLNTYQARWQYAADSCGFGFAQGKVMLWQRHVLDRAGGITALAGELAEDAAATKLVRGAGLKVRLAEPSFVQPIGARTVRQMLSRQVRWAQLRRLSFPHFFAPEILTGGLLPILAGMFAMSCLGGPPMQFGAAMLTLWLGAELALARAAGWHIGWMTPAAMMVRDLLVPLVWLKGIAAGSYEWQGTRVEVRRADAGETRTVGV